MLVVRVSRLFQNNLEHEINHVTRHLYVKDKYKN